MTAVTDHMTVPGAAPQRKTPKGTFDIIFKNASFLSALFVLVLLAGIMLSMVIGGAAWWLVVASPVHLFLHMKGTYQRSGFGTLARMFVLFILTSVTFSLLALLWLYLGFNEMAGH